MGGTPPRAVFGRCAWRCRLAAECQGGHPRQLRWVSAARGPARANSADCARQHADGGTTAAGRTPTDTRDVTERDALATETSQQLAAHGRSDGGGRRGTEGSRDVIRGCGGTKKHRKSHCSSPFNRRVKNLSVTGHLRSETKVRLLRSRRGPILTGRPHRHSPSALEQGEGQRQGPTPTRQKTAAAFVVPPSAMPQNSSKLLVVRCLLTGRKLNLNPPSHARGPQWRVAWL